MNDDVRTWLRHRFFGKYRGQVVDNDDPTQRGRLKVKVPAVLGALELWAMPCVPYAGPQVGFYSLPDAGTGVWVEFEGGDPSFPIWVGCFWADQELPDPGGPDVKIWRTRSVRVRADDGAETLLADSTGGASVKVDQAVENKAGSATHTVTTTAVTSAVSPKKVALTAVKLDVNQGSLEVF